MLIVPNDSPPRRGTPERRTWRTLPDAIRGLQDRWSLSLGAPFEGSDGSCAWVAPAARRDGTRAVLKLGMPHMEATHEVQGLRFWDGNATVRLLESDADLNAMLLERCEPGTALRELPERRMSWSPACSAVSGGGRSQRIRSVRSLQ
jgi:streptomycin 6-kinase